MFCFVRTATSWMDDIIVIDRHNSRFHTGRRRVCSLPFVLYIESLRIIHRSVASFKPNKCTCVCGKGKALLTSFKTLCLLGNLTCICRLSISTFSKYISKIPSECQSVWILICRRFIRPDLDQNCPLSFNWNRNDIWPPSLTSNISIPMVKIS